MTGHPFPTRSLPLWTALAALCVLSAPLQAQTHGHGGHGAATMTAAPATAMSEGEIRKVDAAAGKLTIRHGEIKNLDMPPMTMVFKAQDPAMLAMVKAGDKVRFQAAQVGGTLVVTAMETAP